MAKRKVDKKVVHVIQLQQTEREMFETMVTADAAGKVLTGAGAVIAGVGTVLAPFAGVLTALGALWIADRTFDELVENVKQVKEEAEDLGLLENPFAPASINVYTNFCAYLQTWNWGESADLAWLQSSNPPPFFMKKVSYFFNVLQQKNPPNTPHQTWISFYPPVDFAKDFAQYRKQLLSSTAGGILPSWLNPLA